ncbi:unnamed protein product [marine sediment metagenome]|uniref:Uncharacterized protein n=1 Tax=marine sediment metagenome TaxID=412755 RepID=X0ZXU6_9ZZZZ
MRVEIAYATPDDQLIIAVDVADDATVKEAISESSITAHFAEIDINNAQVGIFSQRATLETKLHPGDRVEIYRPLTIDPKTARILRASKRSAK